MWYNIHVVITMKTYKVQLKFSDRNAEAFWRKQLSLCRDCYNFAADVIWNDKSVQLGMSALHKAVYRRERDAFPELMAQLAIQTNRAVSANYRTNKRKFKCVNKRPFVQLDKRTYSHLTRNSIRLASGIPNKRCTVDFVLYAKFSQLADKYAMSDPRIHLRDNGTFWLSVMFKVPAIPVKDDNDAVGIDLGCRRIATTSDGVAYTDSKYLARRRRIRHLKRQLRRNHRHSHSARTKLKSIRRHEANVSKDMCHRLSNEILKTTHSVIVMEDLTKIKERTKKIAGTDVKRTRHNNRISQVPFYLLRQILAYKALHAGKRVETVSPHFTSQVDSRTGTKDGCERIGCRFYAADGVVLDADWNAAVNICNRYHPHSSSAVPLDGRLDLRGRAHQPPERRTTRESGRGKLTDLSVSS